MRRLVPIALAAAALAGLAAQAGRADGDPASDVLYFQDVFLPYVKPSADAAAKLTATVAAANKAGFRIKVAVIAPSRISARCRACSTGRTSTRASSASSCKSFYTQRLLVVMPAGFGVYDNGKPVDAEKRRSPGSRSPRPTRTV